jgi:hypothetical protein
MHNNTGNVDYQRPSSNVFAVGSLLPLAVFIIADINKFILYSFTADIFWQ